VNAVLERPTSETPIDMRARLAALNDRIRKLTAENGQDESTIARMEADIAAQQVPITARDRADAKYMEFLERRASGESIPDKTIDAAEVEQKEAQRGATRAENVISVTQKKRLEVQQRIADRNGEIEALRREHAKVLRDLFDAESLQEREALTADEVKFAREVIAPRLGRIVGRRRVTNGPGVSIAATVDDIVEMPSIAYSRWSPVPGGSIRHGPIVRINLQAEIEAAAVEVERQLVAEFGLA
jgi:hypothetical protein